MMLKISAVYIEKQKIFSKPRMNLFQYQDNQLYLPSQFSVKDLAFVFTEFVISNRIFFEKPTKYIRSQAFQLLKTVQIIIYSIALTLSVTTWRKKRPPMTNTQLIPINKNSLMPLIENYVKNEY